jgi:hypothetical protein
MTMSDRELIADTLATTIGTEVDHADAVLAALGDRLLPEVPEGWTVVYATKFVGSEVVVTNGEDGGERRVLNGTGPTIAGAIRNALEGV